VDGAGAAGAHRRQHRAVAFGLAVVFVFLVLAAMYESWLLPLAVVLIAPMSVLAALLGVNTPASTTTSSSRWASWCWSASPRRMRS
jgi:multidrug efflux pump subunit AcrB